MSLTTYRTGVGTLIRLEDGSYIAAKGTTTDRKSARVWSSTGMARRFLRSQGLYGTPGIELDFALFLRCGTRI